MATLFKIFVKATAILMFFAATSVAQIPDKSTAQDSSDIRVLEESIKRIDDKIADNKTEIKDELDDKFVELNTRMYIYIGFVVAMIAFIGFFLNFFGKKTIRTWIDEIIKEIAKEELDVRLEPIYIKYKDEKTKELEERWDSHLKEIEEKWTSYQQDMKKSLKKIEDQQAISAEEIEHTIKSLEEVKQEKDFSADDWFFKAYNEAQQRNNEKAVEYFDKTTELDPNYAVAYYNRGVVLTTLKEYEKALADYHKAIELDPGNITAYENMAELLIFKGKYDSAIGKIDEAMIKSVEGKEKAVLLYLNCIARKLLRRDTIEAEIALEEILKEDIRLTWSPDEIEEWMKGADIPEETRKFIIEKTSQMKAKKKSE